MKKLWLLALLALPALADVQEGVLEKTAFTVTLNGQVDTIALRPYRVEDGGYFATLVVLKPDGTVLWESNLVVEATDPMAFGSWPIGVSLPQIVGDFDKDKQIELITPMPVSDVRPVEFKVLRWLDGTFRPAYTRALLLGKDGHVRWTVPKEGNQTWVSSFDGWKGDQFQVHLMSTDGKSGQAVLTAERGGFALVKWVTPLK